MRKLTGLQLSLLQLVKDHNNSNTHQLATYNGDRQAYESNLRDRLFRLQPFVSFTEYTKDGIVENPNDGKFRTITRRIWSITEAGIAELQKLEAAQ